MSTATTLPSTLTSRSTRNLDIGGYHIVEVNNSRQGMTGSVFIYLFPYMSTLWAETLFSYIFSATSLCKQ